MTDSGKLPMTRRALLHRIGISSGGMLMLGSSGVVQTLAAVPVGRFGGGSVGLELDGVTTDVRAFEGGSAYADVQTEPSGVDQWTDKRLRDVRFDDIVLKVPFDVAPTLASWIQDSIAKAPVARSGAIVFYDANLVEWKRLVFSNALITEIALPVVDASNRDPLQMTIRLTPESTRWTGGSGKAGKTSSPTKLLRASGGVRFSVQGCEEAAPFITKVEGLGVKRALLSAAEGQQRFKRISTGALDVPPIKIFLPEMRAANYYNWFDSVVMKGGASGDGERQGLVEWLTPDRTGVIASAQLQNLGIVRFAPEPYTPNSETAPLVKVELYCERLSISFPA